ncbi:MAG: hypothetical protein AAGD11_20205 [Planctomycetota bacterium]
MRDIDQIIVEVKKSLPNIQVSQLSVTHPSDDDGLWFFRLLSESNEVQIESSSGNCPFLIEHDAANERFTGVDVAGVTAKVVELAQL